MFPINRRRLLSWLSTLASLASLSRDAHAQQKGNEGVSNKHAGDRIEPLFLSADDARAVMRDHCMEGTDQPISAKHVELIISRLRPQAWIARRSDGGGPGETRFGGAPDLPNVMAWPIRPVPPDVAEKSKQWALHHAWIVTQLQHALPFEFIGQIDLQDAAQFLEPTEGLPATGRLLFFWDGSVGLLESGSAACHVIYDDTPVENLVRAPIPAKFAEMAAWWREPDPKSTAHFEKMARTLEAADQKAAAEAMRNVAKKSEAPGPDSTKPFVYPARAMRLVPLLVLPSQNSIELTLDVELTAFANGDDTSEQYSVLTSNDMGPFTADRSNMRRTQEYVSSEARRMRLMGPPHPEQDDPRFDALPRSELPPYPWNDAQIAETSRKAADWLLLLQVSIADLTQLDTEGTVYFMVHKDDLAKRDFARVVASYQQT